MNKYASFIAISFETMMVYYYNHFSLMITGYSAESFYYNISVSVPLSLWHKPYFY